MEKPYKKAKLYNAKGDINKEWYVEFYYLKPGTLNDFQRFKERFDLNKHKTLTVRTLYGSELVKFINQKLQDGFNPFDAIKTNKTYQVDEQLTIIKKRMSRNASSNAITTYTLNYKRLISFLESKCYLERSMAGITISEIPTFIEDIFRGGHANMFRNYEY